MHDILIRGMELESGRIAEILIAPDGNVYRNRREFCLGFGPIAHATKIPPHGDLISRDDLYKIMETYTDYGGETEPHDENQIHRDSILFAIENAPVVVPAERRE